MKLRDYVAKTNPSNVCENFVGGVSGCPTDYEEISHMGKLCGGDKCSDVFCHTCWSRELEEKNQNAK